MPLTPFPVTPQSTTSAAGGSASGASGSSPGTSIMSSTVQVVAQGNYNATSGNIDLQQGSGGAALVQELTAEQLIREDTITQRAILMQLCRLNGDSFANLFDAAANWAPMNR